MKIELEKKPRNSILIEGFPGFGLVGTIATEFLIDHLKAKKIGRIVSDKISPMVAVHDEKVIDPLGIFYDSKTNILILHALIGINGLEWELAEILNQLCKEIKVGEIISIEGIGSQAIMMPNATDASKSYFYSQNPKKWLSSGSLPLKEGIVMGVTGALLLNIKDVPLSCLFAETHTNLPDSRAAAKVIEVLDSYLGLKIDYKPLLKKAEEFEEKLKTLLEKGKSASKLKEQKDELNYLG
ncbi:MAG: PAC2 family protein [Nanoarchaeota archaeon]